jgi:hypothetical protein
MIDRHYIKTIARYVDELASKNALMVHTEATPALMRKLVMLSKTVTNLAEAALSDTADGNDIQATGTNLTDEDLRRVREFCSALHARMDFHKTVAPGYEECFRQ